MPALSERDAAGLTAVVAEIAALDEPEPFPAWIVGRITELTPATCGFYAEYDASGWRTDTCWRDGSLVPADDPDSARAEQAWNAFGHQHPVRVYRERSGDWTSTRLVSDFTTRREFERTELWNELYRERRIWGWIAVSFQPHGEHHRKFNFLRSQDDFSPHERLVIDVLRPHLVRRLQTVRITAEAVEALAEIDDAPDSEPCDVVLCSARGTIEFASPRSRRLLAQYFDHANGRIPELLRRSRTLTVARGDRRLTARTARTGDLLVVLLAERDTRVDRLTARQRTVLDHVARGATDAEIALALGISTATVGKHLEQIYERLGVHTRTAAAALL
jgi:DNA-binding CsgD family transcriptional regulator